LRSGESAELDTHSYSRDDTNAWFRVLSVCPEGQFSTPEGLIHTEADSLVSLAALLAVKETSQRLVRRRANPTNADKKNTQTYEHN
jgi:hypothetical protein